MRMSAAVVVALASAAQVTSAATVDQYASSVIDYSSQYSIDSWSAKQALGESNTTNYGDIPTSWAAKLANGGLEFISLGFNTPVYSTGTVIRETWGNGFVFQVDAVDTNNILHTVWSGTDSSAAGAPVDFSLSWSTTSFQTVGLKIYVNGNHSTSWEEIDSVKLTGVTAPVPEPETYALMLAGLGALSFVSRRSSKQQ